MPTVEPESRPRLVATFALATVLILAGGIGLVWELRVFGPVVAHQEPLVPVLHDDVDIYNEARTMNDISVLGCDEVSQVTWYFHSNAEVSLIVTFTGDILQLCDEMFVGWDSSELAERVVGEPQVADYVAGDEDYEVLRGEAPIIHRKELHFRVPGYYADLVASQPEPEFLESGGSRGWAVVQRMVRVRFRDLLSYSFLEEAEFQFSLKTRGGWELCCPRVVIATSARYDIAAAGPGFERTGDSTYGADAMSLTVAKKSAGDRTRYFVKLRDRQKRLRRESRLVLFSAVLGLALGVFAEAILSQEVLAWLRRRVVEREPETDAEAPADQTQE